MFNFWNKTPTDNISALFGKQTLNEPEYPNRNVLNYFGLTDTVDDGILHQTSKPVNIQANHKITFESDNQPMKWEQNLDEHTTSHMSIHQQKYASGLQLPFTNTDVKISDRITNKKLRADGTNPLYIPHKTGMAKASRELAQTTKPTMDDSVNIHIQNFSL
jgi:hypothetical protein